MMSEVVLMVICGCLKNYVLCVMWFELETECEVLIRVLIHIKSINDYESLIANG